MHWNFASPDWCCPSAENDLSVGGKYQARMEAKDGSMGFDFEATYQTINTHSNFTYHIADGRLVTVTFTPISATNCKIDIEFEAENTHPIEMQRAGWQAILTNFKNYTDSFASKST